MFLIRPVKESDLEQLLKLVAKTGPGMTSLPADAALLGAKITNSINSFHINPEKPIRESYMFVLEENGIIRACSAIRAKIGGAQPFYSYEIHIAHHKSVELNIDKEIEYLQLKTEHDGPTIISSLFVDPAERGKNYGKYMGLVRFLFMADFRSRFEDTVIAEMRGVINSEGKSPFWEATVRHFMDMEFDRADFLSAGDKGFIADLMPKHPIYIPLLSPSVRAAIGALHEVTKTAMKFLEDEGFKWDKNVDIFDAGPRVACKTDEIKSLKNSIRTSFELGSPQGGLALITNSRLEFRATVAKLEYMKGTSQQGTIAQSIISQETADLLQLAQGESLRFVYI